MSVSEKELPFELPVKEAGTHKLEPGFVDRILIPDQMYKEVTPYYIKTSIRNCFACEHNDFKKPVELSNFDASVMVIGETPSDIDFQTKEGKLLADTLLWAGYNLDDVYFTSLTKCQSSSTPERCQSHLLSELLCVQPKLVIALGYEVGKHFNPAINQPGDLSFLMDRYPMITSYRTTYTMSNQNFFREFCLHLSQAKQQLDSKR